MSEASTNLAAIAITQESFFTEKGYYASIDRRLDGTTCEGTGVFSPLSGSKSGKQVLGPCDPSSGRQVFWPGPGDRTTRLRPPRRAADGWRAGRQCIGSQS